MTTATDARGASALDSIGWPVEGAVARVTRAMLDGEPVRLDADAVWPLPPLPLGESGRNRGGSRRGTPGSHPPGDRPVEPVDGNTAVLRPPSLVVGVGASRGVTADEVLDLIDAHVGRRRPLAGLGAAVATVDAKADEQGILDAAAARVWPVTTYPAEGLPRCGPEPERGRRDAVGTPSVAEAAALRRGRRARRAQAEVRPVPW